MKPQTAAMGITYFTVKVEEINGDMAITMDKFGQRREVRTDVMRTNRRPAVGEDWVIDRTLGLWTFAAIIGGEGGGGGGTTTAPTGPTFGYGGRLVDSVSGIHLFRSDQHMTEVVITALISSGADTTIKFWKGHIPDVPTPSDPVAVLNLPPGETLLISDVDIDFVTGDFIYVTASPFDEEDGPLNLVIETTVEAAG